MSELSTILQPGRCRRCGCTEAEACPDGCFWVDEDRTLCSACVYADGEPLEDETWAVVEVMGYRRFVGRISEQRFGGTTMLRVDVPECEGRPAFSKLLSGHAIFSITPVEEDTARAIAKHDRQVPLDVYTLPAELRERLLPETQRTDVSHYEGDEDDELQQEAWTP